MQVLQEDNIWLLSSDESLIESFKVITILKVKIVINLTIRLFSQQRIQI